MQVKKRDGKYEEIEKRKIQQCVDRVCKGLSFVDTSLITEEAFGQLYDGMTTEEIDKATVLAARARIVVEPQYSYAAARLLLHSLYKEVFSHKVDGRSFASDYRKSFKTNLKILVKKGLLSEKLLKNFDIDFMAQALKPERDLLFKYLGIQTLYDRYFQHVEGVRMETPQALWMRVAMGLSLSEPKPEIVAINFYNLFSQFLCCPSTPTLFNAGYKNPQLSSCYLSTVEDSIDGIYGTLHAQARLAKHAGGLAIDITPLRGSGAWIKGTNGKGSGYIPWAKQFNSLASAVNQGSKRKGAAVLYSEVWHIDYPDFLELKKNTGDERLRCHDINTASWICDLFMKQTEIDGPWYLFSPDEVPDLHELYGEAFETKYWEYVEKGKAGKLRVFKEIKAKDLWKKMLGAIKETGHPWKTWKDTANLRHQGQHAGIIHSSNLCTEILEPTKATKWNPQEIKELGETAVCNLLSLNLSNHVDENGEIDYEKLEETIKTSVHALDNGIDENFYPTKEAQSSNLKNRPVGLGLMGWQDVLQKKKIIFDSEKAEKLADKLQEFISYHAILASSELARSRGKYENFDGSNWSKGIFPLDTYNSLTGKNIETNRPQDWDFLKEKVKKDGLRNSLLMAIAPTATISSIQGCSQCIAPDLSVLFVYSTLSGDFTMANEYFVQEMKDLNLWNEEFITKLQQVDGDVSRLPVPKSVKDRFKTAFKVDQKRAIDIAVARQKWIDQGQSLNIFYEGDSMKELSDIYFYAWKSRLPTTYYLHSKAASRIEKTTVGKESKMVCNLEEGCTACQ